METLLLADTPVQLWEICAIIVLLGLMFLVSYDIKSRNIRSHPEYKYYQFGLFAKVLAGFMFYAVYFFYYEGGDTFGYFESSIAMTNLFVRSPSDFLHVYFSEASIENFYIFDQNTGYPWWYMYNELNTFTVVRVITPLAMITFKSYLISTILLSWISFIVIWKTYQVFCYHYRQSRIEGRLAIALLFIPSTVFWGSGILKDTITLSAACLFFIGFYSIFIRRKDYILNSLAMAIGIYLMLLIKPYIFIGLMPGTLLWLSFDRLKRLKSKALFYTLVPFILVGVIVGGFAIFSLLGDALGEYSVGNIVNKAIVTQDDLRREYYGENSFDIGTIDPSVQGILSKAPIAMISGLFRPFIWETNNALMLFSALEGTFLLIILFRSIFGGNVLRLLSKIFDDPFLLFCFSFSLFFAFSIGLTTANFGALVRFKIPMLPFFVAGVFILQQYAKRGRRIT